MNPDINFNVDEVQTILLDRYNVRTEIFEDPVTSDLYHLGVYPKWKDHAGDEHWTVIAGPFGLEDHHDHAHVANIGVFKFKHDDPNTQHVTQMFDRTIREEDVAGAIHDFAAKCWLHEDAEDLVDPTREFFSGDWLVTDPSGATPIRFEYAVEGAQTGSWSGGVEFEVDQVGLEHILQKQYEVLNNKDWFQWDGDTLLYIFNDDPNEPQVMEVKPKPGGDYEMSFGWTWFRVEDPLQCDYIVPASINWQNIVSRVTDSDAGVKNFLRDPQRWLVDHDITTAPAWVVDEAVRRLQQPKPEAVPFPQTEDEARTCIHGNRVWFGHECGLCDASGIYRWSGEEVLIHPDGTETPHLPAQSYASTNPNVNCLEGVRCPSCGQTEEVEVEATVFVSLQDDGITDEGDHHFDNTSKARCTNCDYVGTWGAFQMKVTMTAGQMVAELQKLDPTTPLLGYVGGEVENYVNVDGVHFDPTNPDIAATIELRDDYDTRQW